MEAYSLSQNISINAAENLTGSITNAWLELARAGTAIRYLGQRADGRHQVALSHPATGVPLAMGCGESVAEAIHVALSDLES